MSAELAAFQINPGMVEMQKPKQIRSGRYWESLTDDQLLDTGSTLTTPRALKT